jgi:Nucleotidyl transferase AbiEii toxin, Type IV TA system
MPVSGLHREVAAVALRAAARHGFALGGGNALIAHGVIDRPTEDVDLFTDREHGVAAAAGAVEASLREAGYVAERQDQAAGLAEVFEGMGEGLAEWIITAPDGREVMLQMAYFDRGRQPVLMEFGPVLDLDDVLGGKVAALAGRAAERDYIDVAAALARGCSVAQLIGLAMTLDPGLTAEDFADAGQRLDRLGDDRFARYGLAPEDVTRLREQFAAWPRAPGAVPRTPEGSGA